MDFDKIISDLKNKVYHPVYFLMGEEPFFIDEVSNYIEKNILDDSEKEFNQTVLYGGETNILQVIGEAKSYPMMSNYRVVIIKEAQNMKDLVPKEKSDPSPSLPKGERVERANSSPSGRSGGVVHPLENYLDNPQKTTILVFCHKYKTIDMRTGFAKNLSKRAVVLKSDTLYDYKVPKWIEEFIADKKYSIEPRASQLLTEFLGNDLSKIANELEKLFLNIPEKSKITSDHIQKYIGISKEYNNFELQDAIGKKDSLKANRIINYFSANTKDNPMVVTVASLAGYFSKMLLYHMVKGKPQNEIAATLKVPPFFVKDYASASNNYPPGKIFSAISLLREYDMKSKGYENSNIDEGELMKEMVYKIMH
ncbi:MAG: DNA polymerase III subunit delta [Bacteroidetes bacterium]|nr:DNA polymerase III subunit delta [Bacteroidota bacterium]